MFWKEVTEKTLNYKLLSRVFRSIDDGQSLKQDELFFA